MSLDRSFPRGMIPDEFTSGTVWEGMLATPIVLKFSCQPGGGGKLEAWW